MEFPQPMIRPSFRLPHTITIPLATLHASSPKRYSALRCKPHNLAELPSAPPSSL